MKTKAMTGYFDVTEYKKGVELKDRKLKAETDQIAFNVTFKPDQMPQEFAKYCKPYETRDHEQRIKVVFKIGSKVRWFDGNAHPMSKPLNADLNKKRFQAVIEYSQLDGDPTAKEASGYWVNAIMIEEQQDNPFEGEPLRATPIEPQPSDADAEEHDVF